VTSRLHDLLTKVQDVAGKVIRIGKVLLMQILDFVEENFFLVAGVGIGAILGAAVFGLITSIPMVGGFLAPLANILRITITATGAIIGHEIDQILPSVGKSLREIVEEFFKFLVRVFNTVFGYENSTGFFAAS
jgi:hypothetical protein